MPLCSHGEIITCIADLVTYFMDRWLVKVGVVWNCLELYLGDVLDLIGIVGVAPWSCLEW